MNTDDLNPADQPGPKVTYVGPFISADDAAVWAHQRIDQHDAEYGGAILQKNARFYVSAPVRGLTGSFKPSEVIAVDDAGKMILPTGYAPYAYYHSHPDDIEKFKNTLLTEAQRQIVQGMFSYADTRFIIDHGSVVPAHYLSGPSGALLKYVASGSRKERELRARIEEGKYRGFGVFLDYIPQLAEAGELSVIVANSAWGGVRGRVDKHWTLGTVLSEGAMQPLFGKVSASPDFSQLLPVNTGVVYGYLLKAIDKEQYVAPLKRWERRELTPPAQVFPPRTDGGVRLPSNFRIHTLYCRPLTPATWLHPHFFTPAMLATAAEQLRAAPELYDREQRLRLVMRSDDGALLAYRFSGTDSEAQFLGEGGASVEQQLKAGTLSTRQFVSRMAGMGEFSVLQTGSQWIRVGRVPPDVDVFALLQKSMSPAFITADDAARYRHERAHVHGRDEVRLGYVLQRDDGLFVSTDSIGESPLRIQIGLTSEHIAADLGMPAGYRYAGFMVFMSNTLDTAKRNLAARSEEEVRLGKKLGLEEDARLFLSTPNSEFAASIMDGTHNIPVLYYSSPFESLVKYVRSNSPQERDFSGFLREARRLDAFKAQLDGFDGSPTEMVRKLVRLGEFHVLETSATWGNSLGKLPSNWAPYKPFEAAAPIAPAYSFVLLTAGSAAEHCFYEQSLIGGQLCFILKAQEGERYVVTRPVALRPGLPVFSRQQVFNGLPPGFVPHGVCHLPLPPVGLKIAEHWLYESFIAPGEMAAAIAASRQEENPLRVLFLRTRDGAQLKYTFSGSALESQLYNVMPTGVVTDNGHLAALIANHQRPRQYVLQVAAAGRLEVIKTGTMWDVEGVVDSRWKPFFRYPTLTLSPRFLSADDAARFAHEQVGSQRDTEYCGLILQTANQRFVATLPWPCRGAHRFNLGALFPADHTGTLIVPHRFTLHGQYASCTALSLLDSTRMQRYGWSRNEAYVDGQLFNDGDMHSIIGNRHQVSVAYLSCDEEALLGYDLSGSAAELALLAQLEPGTSGSAMERRRSSGDIRPENLVSVLAALGLRVVCGSRLWGAAGAVAAHWRAFPALPAYEKPQQVGFGAVFASADEAAQQTHARVQRAYGSTQTCFAFVLKHGQKDEYVVSETVPVDRDTTLFSLASLFSTDDESAYVYPAGFALHGLFYARRWMPKGLSNGELWLASHFISSADLYSAFLTAKRWRPVGSSTSAPVFISTLDNALLKYQAPVTTRLFDAEKQASGVFEDVHTKLTSGQLTAQAFVKQVIGSSDLSVVVANECWDEAGKLTADWLPYAAFKRRAMSPAFLSQDDAVRYAQAQLGEPGDQVQGGLVLRRLDGLFVATEPMPVPEENFDPKWILPDEDVRQDRLAPSMTLVARYRSRVETLPRFLLNPDELPVYRGMLTTDVLAKAFECSHLWSHEYLLGFDGSLVGFSCSGPNDDLLSARQKSQAALDRQQLLNDLAPASQTPHDPQSNLIEQQLRDGRKTPTEFVNQVLKAASMQVVQGSQLWGAVQALPRGWQPAHGYIPPELGNFATADRAFSPVFTHLDDVGRYVHGLAGDRSRLTYGFIVKAGNGHWMASLPVQGDDLQFARNRVWPSGRLPSGCSVHGLYVHTTARQPAELPASPTYHAFVNPSLLRALLNTVRVSTTGADTFQPLFLSCADGALLKYQATVHDADWADQPRLEAFVKKLNGAYYAANYIHQVARAGALEVLVTGNIWASQGPVTQRWNASEALAYVPRADERLALGPLFSHADDAARYQWRRVRHEPGKSWLGAILGNGTAPSSNFLVTDPVDDSGPIPEVGLWLLTPAYTRLFGGLNNLSNPRPTPKYPAGYRVLGVQQFYKLEDRSEPLTDRAEETLAANFVANHTFRAVVETLRDAKVMGSRYYITPRNGALLMYLPSYERGERDLLLLQWMDPITDKPKALPSQVVATLANVGQLHILEPDSYWQPRGQLDTRGVMALLRSRQP